MFLREAKYAAEAMCWRAKIPIPEYDVDNESCKDKASVGSCIGNDCMKKVWVSWSNKLQKFFTGGLEEETI